MTKEAYTQWVKGRVKEVLLSFPPEPSMNIKYVVSVVVPISEIDKLKEVIKVLEKENVDL